MILALDLALTTGWAVDDNGDISTGVWNLRDREDPSPGRNRSVGPALTLMNCLHAVHGSDFKIEKIILENPIIAQAGANTWIQISLQTAVMLFCYRGEIPFVRHQPNEWKLHILGKGYGNCKREKYLALAHEKWPELDLRTDDEAAARCLLEMELLGVATK